MSGIQMLMMGGGSFKFVSIENFTIQDTDLSISPDISPDSAFASSEYQLSSDGVAYFNRVAQTDGFIPGQWRIVGNSSDYDVRFSLVSGAATGSAFNVWLNLGSTRSILVSASRSGVGSSTQSGVVFVEIRNTASGIVLATATITLEATATVEI